MGEPTTKTKSFENMLMLLFVCAFVTVATAFCRVIFVMVRAGGPKKTYDGYPKMLTVDSMVQTWIALTDQQMKQETLSAVFSVFTESDRHAFLKIVHAFQHASMHLVSVPVHFGARMFVPAVAMTEGDATNNFASQIKQDISTSKL